MGQTTEPKPIIPLQLIPSAGSQAIVGRHFSQRPALQDGGVFYDLETGDEVENLYPQYAESDGDVEAAEAACERFLEIHPWYRMATPEEMDWAILKATGLL